MFMIAEKMFTSKSAKVRLQKEHCDIDKSLKADIQESLCLKLLQQFSSRVDETCYTWSLCNVDLHDIYFLGLTQGF